MHNPSSVPENESHVLLWDFDHLISARQPDLVIIYKKCICRIVDFAVPPDHRVKLKESEKKDKYLDFVKKLKKTVEHESDVNITCNWWTW